MAPSELDSELADMTLSTPLAPGVSIEGTHVTRGLPRELLLHMLQYITSTTFIAFSQACRPFRQLTMPDRHHFMLRLLELELTAEHGGGVSRITIFGVITPSLYDDAGWQNIRYACVGCLKLRTHRDFANSAILGLPYRKPESHMLAARMLAEPGNVRVRTKRSSKAEGTRHDQLRSEKKLRREISLTITPSSPSSVQIPGWHSSQDEIQQYHDFISRNEGKQRYRRLCADCNLSHGRRRDFTEAYLDSNPAATLRIVFHARTPLSSPRYRFHVPQISTRWYSDFAPASQALAKDHIKSLGSKAAKRRICGRWRALLGFMRPTPSDFCDVLGSALMSDVSDEALFRCVCWECRNRERIERGGDCGEDAVHEDGYEGFELSV